MKLYIPEIGDIIELAEDWKFPLHNEDRNNTVIVALNLLDDPKFAHADDLYVRNAPRYAGRMEWTWDVVIPKGTKLKIDRIYIRKGNEGYSSITFYVEDSPVKELLANHPVRKLDWYGRLNPNFTKTTKAKKRFWAKLDDVNQIVFKGA